MNTRFRLAPFLVLATVLGFSPLLTFAAAPEGEAHPAQTGEVLNFALIDHQGRLHELRRLGGKAVVLYFTANECPVARQSASKIRSLRDRFSEKGVSVFMVNSSMADDRESIAIEAAQLRAWHVPVLKDDTQGVARHLGVKRTGEAIAISASDWKVFYRGAIDDQMVEGAQKPKATERYLENALNDFLDGKPIAVPKALRAGKERIPSKKWIYRPLPSGLSVRLTLFCGCPKPNRFRRLAC